MSQGLIFQKKARICLQKLQTIYITNKTENLNKSMKIKLKLTVLMLRQSEKFELITHTYIHTDRQADRQVKKS